ncbi:MAG: hypothetical protein WC595_01835 [Candidatus Nanoarchaeia archaeon]
MPKKEIVDYLQKYLNQYSLEQLKNELLKQGYEKNEIEEAASLLKNKPTNTSQFTQSDLTTFDEKTKETIIASIIGLVIAQLLIFFGDFLIGKEALFSGIWTLVYAVIAGAVAGFLIAKLYTPLMDFISTNISFLLPLTNTFFKFLFVPAVIAALILLIFSLFAGAAIFALGAGLGGSVGGVLGGLLGGSFILSTSWTIFITLLARFIYAKFMTYKVGKYYKDYK